MDKDQEDKDKLQKALLKKNRESFGWGDFVFGSIIIAIVFGVVFVVEHILNWMYFYD